MPPHGSHFNSNCLSTGTLQRKSWNNILSSKRTNFTFLQTQNSFVLEKEKRYLLGDTFLKLVLEYQIYILSFSYPKVYTKSSLVSRGPDQGLFCVNWDSVVKWGGLKSLTCSPKDFAGVRDKCQWTSQLVCLQKCTNKSSRQFSKKTAKKLLTGWLMTCEKVCENIRDIKYMSSMLRLQTILGQSLITISLQRLEIE